MSRRRWVGIIELRWFAMPFDDPQPSATLTPRREAIAVAIEGPIDLSAIVV